MTENQTLEKMKILKLYGMARTYENINRLGGKSSYTADSLIAELIEDEFVERQNRKLSRLLKQADLRYNCTIEEIDFDTPRNLEKNVILEFSKVQWINQCKNLIITGLTGSGKSFIGCAIGNQSCINGKKTIYFRTSKLFSLLKNSKVDGSYFEEIDKFIKYDLLILDDFGLDKFDKENRLALLEIVESRYKRKSTIIISQLPINKWNEIIGDDTISDAILDRVVHNAYKLDLKSKESFRKKYQN